MDYHSDFICQEQVESTETKESKALTEGSFPQSWVWQNTSHLFCFQEDPADFILIYWWSSQPWMITVTELLRPEVAQIASVLDSLIQLMDQKSTCTCSYSMYQCLATQNSFQTSSIFLSWKLVRGTNISGLTSDQLSQNPYFNKISGQFICPLMFQRCYSRLLAWCLNILSVNYANAHWFPFEY